MRRVLIGMIGAAALGVFAAPASAQDAKIEKGMQVFTVQKCSLCHAIAGKGNAKGSLDDIGTKLTPDVIRQWIVDPVAMAAKQKADRKPPMPSKYASLPKEDLDALVAYLSSLKKK